MQGKGVGLEEAQIKFALACLAKGFSIGMTAELTGLSEEKVQEIKDGLDKEEK
ncbi:MAG: hypothetical protein JJT94_11325 [Bernardetiaceae bacterium]|nr:hypothetical protein [Bernardetiaceae bacterium]